MIYKSHLTCESTALVCTEYNNTIFIRIYYYRKLSNEYTKFMYCNSHLTIARSTVICSNYDKVSIFQNLHNLSIDLIIQLSVDWRCTTLISNKYNGLSCCNVLCWTHTKNASSRNLISLTLGYRKFFIYITHLPSDWCKCNINLS